MNPDYCICNEFENVVDHIDFRYYKVKDYRINMTKWNNRVGISTIWTIDVRLLI